MQKIDKLGARHFIYPHFVEYTHCPIRQWSRKPSPVRHFIEKNLRILVEMSHLLLFFFIFLCSSLFSSNIHTIHIDFTTSIKWKKCSSILATETP